MITSGDLFGIIQFYKQVITTDFAGATNGSYSLYLYTRANIGPLIGRRALEDGQRQDVDTVQFTMRWRQDLQITSDLIIVYQNLPYAIYSIVDTNNKRKQFVILARAKEGLTSMPLSTGGVMEFKNQFKTQFG